MGRHAHPQDADRCRRRQGSGGRRDAVSRVLGLEAIQGGEDAALKGANVNVQDKRGRTALHIGIEKEFDPALLKWLVKHGASPDIPDREGMTAARRPRASATRSSWPRSRRRVMTGVSIRASRSKILRDRPDLFRLTCADHAEFSPSGYSMLARDCGGAIPDRNTHLAGIQSWSWAGSIALVIRVTALDAQSREESARTAAGLLGGFGLIPVGLGAYSAASRSLRSRWPRRFTTPTRRAYTYRHELARGRTVVARRHCDRAGARHQALRADDPDRRDRRHLLLQVERRGRRHRRGARGLRQDLHPREGRRGRHPHRRRRPLQDLGRGRQGQIREGDAVSSASRSRSPAPKSRSRTTTTSVPSICKRSNEKESRLR